MELTPQQSNCLFCKSYSVYKKKGTIIYENQDAYAFLNYKPSNFGHSMIVVKPHITSLRDLQYPVLNQFFEAIENTYEQLVKIITNNPQSIMDYYNLLITEPPEPESIECARLQIKNGIPSSPPKGFNWGMNYGYQAGQRVSHLHIHLFPRYKGLGIATAMRKHLNKN